MTPAVSGRAFSVLFLLRRLGCLSRQMEPVTITANNKLMRRYMLVRTKLTQSYIELLKKSLVNELYIENEVRLLYILNCAINNVGISLDDIYNIGTQDGLMRQVKEGKVCGNVFVFNEQKADGSTGPAHHLRNYTEFCHSMIGKKRLDNIQHCMESVLDEGVPGDMIETGIWRGGATIFMRGILAAYGITDRVVWAADSFQGVPPPTLPEDANFDISARVYPFLAVSLFEVKELFRRYDLLDEQVRFVKGWFKDALPRAPIEKLAVLRLDGDLYESTMDALNPLYHKVSPGGFIIVDDYFSCPPCRRAIDEFRTTKGIEDELVRIDDQSVYWRKSPAAE